MMMMMMMMEDVFFSSSARNRPWDRSSADHSGRRRACSRLAPIVLRDNARRRSSGRPSTAVRPSRPDGKRRQRGCNSDDLCLSLPEEGWRNDGPMIAEEAVERLS